MSLLKDIQIFIAENPGLSGGDKARDNAVDWLKKLGVSL